MSEHRRTISRLVGVPVSRRRRWVISAVGALGASGLILGGLGAPVSADDVSAGVKPNASASLQDGCVTATAGTSEAEGSVQPEGDGSQLQAAGDGTATVSVCEGDLDDPPGGDPGDPVPGDLDDAVPDPDDVVPGDPGGSLAAELVAEVTGALEGGLPGDGSLPGDPGDLPGDPGDLPDGVDLDEIGDIIPGGPGGGSPGDLGDLVPGDLGGLAPDGSGIDPGDLLDRLALIIPGGVDDGDGPGGNGNGGPVADTSTTGSVSQSVAVAGDTAESDAPTELVLGAEVERGAPSPGGMALSPGAALPRTGGGLGNGVLRLVALLGLGRAGLGLVNRRRPAARLGLD